MTEFRNLGHEQEPLVVRVRRAQKGLCFYCDEPLALEMGPGLTTRDHFYPRSRLRYVRNQMLKDKTKIERKELRQIIADWSARNIVLACYDCNGDKQDRLPTLEEYDKYALIFGAFHPLDERSEER